MGGWQDFQGIDRYLPCIGFAYMNDWKCENLHTRSGVYDRLRNIGARFVGSVLPSDDNILYGRRFLSSCPIAGMPTASWCWQKEENSEVTIFQWSIFRGYVSFREVSLVFFFVKRIFCCSIFVLSLCCMIPSTCQGGSTNKTCLNYIP